VKVKVNLGVCILLRVWDQGESAFRLPTILKLRTRKTLSP
jgi:hypothetical protein